MFGIKKLKEQFDTLELIIKNNKQEIDDKIEKYSELILGQSDAQMDELLNVFRNEINIRLDTFHKEISDKYIQAIERIIQTTKETMLIDTLIKQTSEKDINNLKRVLLQPILEEKWKENNIEKIENIQRYINGGLLKIVEERNKIEQEKLKLEREGKDSKFISGQLSMLDNIIKESKNAL